jgi:aminoglycoside/choline kinase family phosphotransferase
MIKKIRINMDKINSIKNAYREIFGNDTIDIVQLPQSGSDRKYFRVTSPGRSVICTLNPVPDENDAFVGFSKHFLLKHLPVPEIYGYLREKNIYFQSDLGDINLFTWLRNKPADKRFGKDTRELYHKILDNLVLFQTKGIEGLNLDICYPHRSFDRQSMMWDMNYFKYMLLKLLGIPFNERRLEHDFNLLADYLLGAGQNFFLYRDFQSANIMIVGNDPWFIDYQGGRKGAAQYDIASLLFDAKVPIPHQIRTDLFDYYRDRFCYVTGTDKVEFTGHYIGFTMIRLMQAMGTFGFRGLYENKPTFTDSLVPGLNLLLGVIERSEKHIDLPELYQAISLAPGTEKYRQLSESESNTGL